jgi:hypothetical protein
MRARQRHLNKSLRETACAFDSRFLSGFSDGNEVDTWTDLSANGRNATQATSANRPTYKTAIQGGNPILRFDGTNDILQTSSFANGSQCTAILVLSSASWASPTSYRHSFVHGYGATSPTTSGSAFAVQANSGFNYWATNDVFAYGNGYQSTSPYATGAPASGSDFRIISTVFWTSLSRIYANGVRLSTRAESTAAVNSFTRDAAIGAPLSAGERWNGDIAAVIYYTSNIGEPMRSRIERSNALAFKIACS